MNFADILEKWDKQTAGAYVDKDADTTEEKKAKKRSRLLRKKPDAAIDLHGLTRDEAWEALDNFFQRSRTMGLEKIQVIHGKGNHSKSEGVLKEITRKYIELCSFAGTSGENRASHGGSGATWVLLKPTDPALSAPDK